MHRPRKIVSFEPPEYLNDYITNSEDDSDHALINFDYCYKATCNIPRTYREAIDSADAHSWVEAMHEELEFLKENNVFELTNLPEGKKTVGSKWVYTTKENFIQNPADHCVYIKQNERLLIVSWVDDLIIAADKFISLSNVKKTLMSESKMKELGKLNYFIGIYFHNTQGCIKRNQKKYIGRVLE